MKLQDVRIENFKCIDDSTPFKVCPITCLVGKNEAGKTALLEALYRLNPIVEADAPFAELKHYPRRRWSEYKERAANNPDNVITTTWSIEDADRAAVEEVLGPNAFTQKTVKIQKGYGNVHLWPDIAIEDKRVIQHLVEDADLHTEEADRLRSAQDIQQLLKRLTEIENPSERETMLAKHAETTFNSNTAKNKAVEILTSRLPKFVYFSNYNRLPGQVSITDLLNRMGQGNPSLLKNSDHVFLALLDLAGIQPDKLNEVDEFEALIAELEAVENRISGEIFNYWSQNQHLKVKFRFDAGRSGDSPPFNDGWVFRTRIENARHRVSVNFDDRSTGFVWFFSFLVWFSQSRKRYGDNLFILLDEPGLSLHGKAQNDLLRYFNERIVPQSPLIYTTHSPFMIDPENLLSVRTVEDVVEKNSPKGTKVHGEVLSTDHDTIFPLQAALCYDISQTLFVGKYPLLVEGPSDLLYLKWFSRQLRQRDRTHLDPKWTISVAGGIDKMNSFVTLFSGKGLNTAVFSDFHVGDKKKLERLRALKIFDEGRILTASSYASADGADADIEDMIGPALYVDIVNKAYKLRGKDAVKAGSLSRPVAAEVKKHFGTLSPGLPRFDHYEPAVYLTRNVVELDAADALPGMDVALDRFERLFKKLNSLLG